MKIKLKKHIDNFEKVWKDKYQFLDQVPTNWKEAQLFKDFAKALYKDVGDVEIEISDDLIRMENVKAFK